jgi:hypothetical protein
MGCSQARGKGLGTTEEKICAIEDLIGLRKITAQTFDLEVRRLSRDHFLSLKQFQSLACRLDLNIGNLQDPPKSVVVTLDENISKYLTSFQEGVMINDVM